MKVLKSRDIKNLLKQGPDKYLILHYQVKNGETYIVEKDNPRNVIGRAYRTVLNDFNTAAFSKPLVYYEFQDMEFFKHNRESNPRIVKQ